MNGEAMLGHAAKIFTQRAKAYGPPAESMELLARRWSVTLGRPVTPAQAVMCLIDLKLTRLAHDPRHQDSIVDVAGYAAVLNELSR